MNGDMIAMPVTRTFIHFSETLFPGLTVRQRAASCPCEARRTEQEQGLEELAPGRTGSEAAQPVVRRKKVRRSTTECQVTCNTQAEAALKAGGGDELSDISTMVSESTYASEGSVNATDFPASSRPIVMGRDPVPPTSNRKQQQKKRHDNAAQRQQQQQQQQRYPHDAGILNINLQELLPLEEQNVPSFASNSQSSPSKKTRANGKAKGKGLAHFDRIPVGIEDDGDFRVVQRLIGPKGAHMRDIVTVSGGAKVWIIGRGSRSWEDDAGPLTICVGASNSTVFATAQRAVRELLFQVHNEHMMYCAAA